MAESTLIQAQKIEPLTDNNYNVWALKISAVLRNKRLYREIIEKEPPTETNAKETWEIKNDEAFSIIILSLSEKQAGQFLGETRAKVVWEKLKNRYAGNIEDRRIDIGLEMKNIKMETNETVKGYITRIRNIASRSAVLGAIIPTKEIVYYTVRGINTKLEKVGTVLRTQRNITLEEVEQILTEEEKRILMKSRDGQSQFSQNWKDEKAYKTTGGYKKKNHRGGCFICGKTNHQAKQCYYRHEVNSNTNNFKGKYNHSGKTEKYRKEQASIAIKPNKEFSFYTNGLNCQEDKYTL